jgi:hypothetical protein
VSRSVLTGDLAPGDTVVVDVEDGKLVTTTVRSCTPDKEKHP